MPPGQPRKPRLSLTKSQLQTGVGAELLALCQAVTEDGVLSKEEIVALRRWLTANRAADLPAVAFLAPTDWDGAVEVFRRVGQRLPRLARVWADANYQAGALAEWIAANARWVLDIVLKRPGQTTFEVQKWRWVVERTFGWFGRYRRLSKDYEHNPLSSETWIYVTAIHRMSRFMLPGKRNRDEHLLRRPRYKRKT